MILLILKQFSEDLEENLINILAKLTLGSKTFSTLSFFNLYSGQRISGEKEVGKLKMAVSQTIYFFIFVPSSKNA